MDPIERAERELGRAREAEGKEALRRLESAREKLEAARGEVGEAELDELETEIDQHERAVRRRDEYEVDQMGSADNPDEEDAA